MDSLTQDLGDRLLGDIGPREFASLQNKRRARKLSNRTINHELGTLRQILKSRGFWGPISDQVKMLRERHDIGRAISRPDEEKLPPQGGVFWIRSLRNFREAQREITRWISRYNEGRPHQALGYLSPRQFRAQQLNLVA